jgi:uncharacterized membrane protein YgcG
VASIAGAIALGAIGAPALAAALEVPATQGRVTDVAELLEPDRRARLEATLERAVAGSGIEVRVLTLPTLAGEDLAEFSVRVARAWGIGHEGRDDGALLLVVRDDRLPHPGSRSATSATAGVPAANTGWSFSTGDCSSFQFALQTM